MLYWKKSLCICLDQLPAGWTPECNVGHATWLEAGAEPVLESPVVLMRIQVEFSLACLMLQFCGGTLLACVACHASPAWL